MRSEFEALLLLLPFAINTVCDGLGLLLRVPHAVADLVMSTTIVVRFIVKHQVQLARLAHSHSLRNIDMLLLFLLLVFAALARLVRP